VLSLYRREPDMRFLSSPQLGSEGSLGLLRKILPGASPRMMGLLTLLVRKRHAAEIPGVMEAFCQKVREFRNLAGAEVFSAQPLSEEQLGRIRDKLAEKLRKTVEITAVVDPQLIGGVLIKAEGYVIDNTVRGSIRRMEKTLMRAN